MLNGAYNGPYERRIKREDGSDGKAITYFRFGLDKQVDEEKEKAQYRDDTDHLR